MNRRTFIKYSFLALSTFYGINLLANEQGAELSPLPSIPVGGIIRPPGAITDKILRAKCISCGVCVNVCHLMKYDSIVIAGIDDFNQLGTPIIKDMRDYPCALCMECPRHCPTGALQQVEKENVKMGMALIDFSLCFGYNGDVCLSCSKACPLGASVFEFYNSNWGNQPYINEKCVGCGLCVKYCPLGGSAIKVVTIGQYRKIRQGYISGFKEILAMTEEQRYNLVYNNNLPQIMARGRLIEREYR
ncbi:MAG TPA: 4Fe-4S binding protein [Nitrospirae bacterium]|nr:4Fe-4S binding protein [Nitrospirota bacterium]